MVVLVLALYFLVWFWRLVRGKVFLFSLEGAIAGLVLVFLFAFLVPQGTRLFFPFKLLVRWLLNTPQQP